MNILMLDVELLPKNYTIRYNGMCVSEIHHS